MAWVRIPSLNTNDPGNTSDTVIYILYGNSTVTSPTENPSGVWDANYVGVWHLNETVVDGQTTGTHDDSTLYANHGTQNNNGPIAGRIAGGQDFDGGSEYVAIDNAGNDINTTQGSVSAWTKLDAMTDWGYVFCARVDLDNRIDLRWDDANGFFDLKYEASNIRQEINTLAVSDSDGQERFVTITWDTSAGASGEVKGYVDGSQVDTTRTGLGTWAGSITEVKIGANCYGGQSVDGMIDEVRISTTARTACWIGASYNNQAWPDDAVTPSPLPAHNPGGGFYDVGAAAAAVELVSFTAVGLDGAVELLVGDGFGDGQPGLPPVPGVVAGGSVGADHGVLDPGPGLLPRGGALRLP